MLGLTTFSGRFKGNVGPATNVPILVPYFVAIVCLSTFVRYSDFLITYKFFCLPLLDSGHNKKLS